MKDLWVSVRERLPKLPDVPWCNVIVLACNEGDTQSRPMVYGRQIIRGRTVEKWLTVRCEETYHIPDFWQPMPKPPKRNKITAKDDEPQ